MIHLVKELLQVQVHHPLFSRLLVVPCPTYGVVRTATGTESET